MNELNLRCMAVGAMGSSNLSTWRPPHGPRGGTTTDTPTSAQGQRMQVQWDGACRNLVPEGALLLYESCGGSSLLGGRAGVATGVGAAPFPLASPRFSLRSVESRTSAAPMRLVAS